jgi:hypothetical protein
MRNLALADLTPPDLEAMLSENETLFVEHKAGLRMRRPKRFVRSQTPWAVGCSSALLMDSQMSVKTTVGIPSWRLS